MVSFLKVCISPPSLSFAVCVCGIFGSLAVLVWFTFSPCVSHWLGSFLLSSSRLALSTFLSFVIEPKAPSYQQNTVIDRVSRAKPGNRDKNVFRSRHFLCPPLELFFLVRCALSHFVCFQSLPVSFCPLLNSYSLLLNATRHRVRSTVHWNWPLLHGPLFISVSFVWAAAYRHATAFLSCIDSTLSTLVVSLRLTYCSLTVLYFSMKRIATSIRSLAPFPYSPLPLLNPNQ